MVYPITFAGSMGVGGFFGVLSALAFKWLGLRAAPREETVLTEATLAFTFPWAAFYAAEALHLSGIVAILFCGMVMAAYTRANFSPPAKALTSRACQLLAKGAETYAT